MYGAKGKVGEAEVFEQDQLKRAAELGFGVKSADEIKLKPLNDESRVEAERIERVLKARSLCVIRVYLVCHLLFRPHLS